MPPDITTTTTRRRDEQQQPAGDVRPAPPRRDVLSDPLQAHGADLQLDEAEPATGLLTADEAKSALDYNKGKRLGSKGWQTVAKVVASAETDLTDKLVQDVAAWQKNKGLGHDGKVGDITLQWLSQEKGGESLDAHIKSEHTVFLGIRKKSRGREARKLEGAIGSKNVSAVTGADDAHEDQVKVGTKWEDLTSDPGIQALLATMPKLDAAKLKSLTAFIKDSGAETKDELAQLLQVLYRVETGKGLMKRMVLSGHSGGESIEGDGMQAIEFSHLAKLNKVFPIAFGQVEDLMISGCNTGHIKLLDTYRKMFPNVRTIWAYAGYSPAGTHAGGSPVHIAKWSRDTKGRGDGNMDKGRKELSKRNQKNDKNVAIWSKTDGYKTDSPEAGSDLSEVIDDLDTYTPAYTEAYDKGVINRGPLGQLQTTLQVLCGNYSDADLTPHGHNLADLRKMNRHVMFLRHWKEVSTYFAKTYGAEVQAGYTEVSETMPDWAKLSRSDALTQIKAFGVAAGKSTGGNAKKAHDRLVAVLEGLDPSQIPLYR